MLFFADPRNEIIISSKYAKDRVENPIPSGPAKTEHPVDLRQLYKLCDVQLKPQ